MNSPLKLIILIFIPLITNGQDKDFYDLDNSYHEIYRNLKVKALKVFTKEFDHGKLTDQYLELIQNFDQNGNIISEREFYDSDSTDGWYITYKYNENHQTIKTDWTWLEDNEQELTEYEYNSKGKLIKSCDYLKEPNETTFKLVNCDRYVYNQDMLEKVYSSDDVVVKSYEKKDGIIFGYSENKTLESKYENGELIYYKQDSTIIKFERNKIGQLLKSTEFDDEGKIIDTTDFEYSNGLLIGVTSKDCFGNLIYKDEYIYEYFQ